MRHTQQDDDIDTLIAQHQGRARWGQRIGGFAFILVILALVIYGLWRGHGAVICNNACEAKGYSQFTTPSGGLECECASTSEFTPIEDIPEKESK